MIFCCRVTSPSQEGSGTPFRKIDDRQECAPVLAAYCAVQVKVRLDVIAFGIGVGEVRLHNAESNVGRVDNLVACLAQFPTP
jgi:hypothetical protein